MPIAAPRRVGVAGLLSLLAGALVLMVAPGNPGALRLAGIGLFWWYAAVAAPLASVLLVAAVQCSVPASASRRPMALAIAGWASPMLLALVAAGAFSGEPDAPALALAALVAPLLAFVVPTGGRKARLNVVAVIAVGAAVGIVLWANLLLFADVAGLLGLPRWAASGLAALIAFVALELARATDAARDATGRARAEGGTASRFARAALRGGGITLLYASALGFVALVALVALSLVVSPWGAWRALASRSALAFSELSPWVTEGRTLTRSTAIDFTEAHRITALSPATYRVLELDRFREGQLHAGESLALRAGDRLVLDAGAHLRFEAGKRIPGSPASGVAWADPPERGGLTALGETLGAMVTLVGAALAFVGPRSALGARSVYVGSAILMALVLSSLSLGVFGAFAAPGLSIGAPAAAAVFDLPAAIAPGPRGRALGALGAVVLVVLFAAMALALRDVLRRAVREPGQADAGWAGGVKLVRPLMRLFLVAAWAASLWGGEASRALWIGLGLAASATLAMRLADDEPGARLVVSLVGVGAFVALSILGSRLPTWAGMLGAYPVLAALPFAWCAARAWGVAADFHR
ncbi:MAG TPA: hypothetical protein VKH82_03280 [Candidatus Binatia bacterium]|nr:hypothetical protein [Candidatus Binatia bacterium]